MISAYEPFFGGAPEGAGALAGALFRGRVEAVGFEILCEPFVGFRTEGVLDLNPFPFDARGRSNGRDG